jgi:hypothetical protein
MRISHLAKCFLARTSRSDMRDSGSGITVAAADAVVVVVVAMLSN